MSQKFPISILVLMLACIAGGCFNTFDFMNKVLEGPKLYFGKDTLDRKDSVKVYFKLATAVRKPLTFKLTPDKEGSLREITVKLNGLALLTADGKEVILNQEEGFSVGTFPGVKEKVIVLTFLPVSDEEKTYTLLFASRSTTGLVTKRVSRLTVKGFHNCNPVAVYNASQLAQGTKYDYSFDASGSFDVDKYWGGEIAVYKYTVTGPSYSHVFQVKKPIIPYSFPGLGIFKVALLVYDNDGGISNEYARQISIE